MCLLDTEATHILERIKGKKTIVINSTNHPLLADFAMGHNTGGSTSLYAK